MGEIKICLTGGGTGGSVTPLLAIAEELNGQELDGQKYSYLWLGTKRGMEKDLVTRMGMEFRPISGGKLRRYFSWLNFIDPVLVVIGFFESLLIMLKNRPTILISAGSFVSVPAVWAASILRVPVLIHQQDLRPGLANKLMVPFARAITVTFEKSLNDYGKKALWIGNFIRREFTDYRVAVEEARWKMNLDKNKPVVMVLGGGTGAASLNKVVVESLPELTRVCQVIHITGLGKISPADVSRNDYHPYEFFHIENLIKAYAAADLVVSRCGMGILTELAFLGKPSILVPLPDSHQEDNARAFSGAKAAIVLDQKELTAEALVNNIKAALSDRHLMEEMGENMRQVIKKGANEKIMAIINDIII